MKCYFCKTEINRSHRCDVPARNNREKDAYRDLCETCYLDYMAGQGYILEGIVWKKKPVCPECGYTKIIDQKHWTGQGSITWNRCIDCGLKFNEKGSERQ